MEPYGGKYFSVSGTYVCSDAKDGNQANTTAKGDVPVRSRRGGRRTQRRAVQHEATVSAAPATGTSKPLATVVVPVRGEAKTLSGDKRPTNCTSVRRRAKLPNTTVTKVVTGVSLETLRALRNGTATENNSSGGDTKMIEEVSRILFMYASRQQQGNNYNFTGHTEFYSNGGILSLDDTEVGGRLGTLGATTTPSTSTVTATREVHVDKTISSVKGFVGTRDVYAHLLSLIESGKLPAESLEVLRAILSHTSRGMKLDTFDVPRRGEPYGGQPVLADTVEDLPKQGSQLTSDPYSHFPLLPARQKEQVKGSAEGGCVGYDGDASCRESSYFRGMDCSQTVVMPVSNLTNAGNSLPSYGCNYPFLGQYTLEKQQDQQFGSQGTSVEGRSGCGGYAHCVETAVQSGAEHDLGVNNQNYDDDDDDDDDADITAMLHSIRDVMQRVLSPQQRRYATFGDVGTAGIVNRDFNDDWNNTFSAASPAPCVTISQAERDTLRSFQQAFLARMRVTGSPEWKSLGTTPSTNLLHAFVDDSGSGGVEMQEQEQEQKEEVEEGRNITNRTLFSYHTTFLEEGDNDNENRTTSDELVVRGASVLTTAIPAAGRENCEECPYQHHHYQLSEERQGLGPIDNRAVMSEAQMSLFFSAMRGGGWQEEEEKKTILSVASAAEKADQFCAWKMNDGRNEKAVSESAMVASTATTLTPSKQWFRSSDTMEHFSRFASTTPHQPTTQKKELILRDGRSPCSPAACDLAMPTYSVMSTVPTTRVKERTKAHPTSLNNNAMPFTTILHGGA